MYEVNCILETDLIYFIFRRIHILEVRLREIRTPELDAGGSGMYWLTTRYSGACTLTDHKRHRKCSCSPPRALECIIKVRQSVNRKWLCFVKHYFCNEKYWLSEWVWSEAMPIQMPIVQFSWANCYWHIPRFSPLIYWNLISPIHVSDDQKSIGSFKACLR
jgi:hypothetical protein